MRLDAEVPADLRGYIPLAPRHQPFALEVVEQLLAQQPGVPQVACFDTAFRNSLPPVEQMLPLPTPSGIGACAATASTAVL